MFTEEEDSYEDNYMLSLIEHPKFKWMPGMKTMHGFRLKEGWIMKEWLKKNIDDMPYPDFTDPATLGCLLHLARKAGEDPDVYVAKFEDGYAVVYHPCDEEEFFSTEGEALARYIASRSKY